MTDVSPTHIFYGQVCKKKFNILLIRITDDTRFGLQVHVQLQANKKESMSIVLFELNCFGVFFILKGMESISFLFSHFNTAFVYLSYFLTC